jgi:hypothetical protein
MSDAIIGTGILLKAGDGQTPENFVTAAEIVSLKPPQLSRNEIDVSTHNAGYAAILGMLRKGQVTGTLNWVPTDPTHSDATGGILGDIIANTKRNWRIAYPPDGLPHWTMPARVQLFDPQDIGVDAAMQVAFALTIDGAITMVNST